ncbi:hypothetical protein RND71_023447 [Anisodus tanguticus]|uniref:Uncharacterized protein n=1 Tax=Anisodus tanguticus TaxID=243964 RepID=A0AAE1RUV5_9SOLA|nr:hypothetical protein RND71_023447 [Anisodus tanguticus]
MGLDDRPLTPSRSNLSNFYSTMKKDEWDTTTSKDVADIPGNIAQGQVPMSKDWLRQHIAELDRKIQELVRARKYYMGLLSSQKGEMMSMSICCREADRQGSAHR